MNYQFAPTPPPPTPPPPPPTIIRSVYTPRTKRLADLCSKWFHPRDDKKHLANNLTISAPAIVLLLACEDSIVALFNTHTSYHTAIIALGARTTFFKN